MRLPRHLTQRRGVFGLAALAGVLGLGGTPSAAAAATIHVTKLTDSGPGALRQAIATAPAGSKIIVPAGTIKLTSGQLLVTKKLEIDGAGPTKTTISGNNAGRVFALIGAPGVTITKLAIVHGRLAQPGSSWSGAAVFVGCASTTKLDSVRVTKNTVDVSGDATHTPGTVMGGIFYNAGGLALVRTTVASNSLRADGGTTNQAGGSVTGGIVYSTGLLSLTDTTVSTNFVNAVGRDAGGGGNISGGLIAAPIGGLAVAGSALNGNLADVDGGTSGGGGGVSGGVIRYDGSALTLKRTRINENTISALGHGGGGGGFVSGGAIYDPAHSLTD